MVLLLKRYLEDSLTLLLDHNVYISVYYLDSSDMGIEKIVSVVRRDAGKLALAGALAAGAAGGEAKAGFDVGDNIGGYKIERKVAQFPSSYASDLEFHNGELYALTNREGVVSKVDLNTGAIDPYLWVKGWGWTTPDGVQDDTLHDAWPFDNPTGMAIMGNDVFMSARWYPNTIRKFSLSGPTTENNPTIVDDIFPLYAEFPMDLTAASDSLFVPLYQSETIARVDPQTGAITGSFPSPDSSVYAMTFDGRDLLTYHFGIDQDRFFTRIGLDGVVKESIPFQADSWFDGAAYDIANKRLFVSDVLGGIWSAKPVPEPGTLSSLALGALFASLRRKRN